MQKPYTGNPRITSKHGSIYPSIPSIPKELWGTPHKGIDVALTIGNPIYAPENGTVAFAGYDKGLGISIQGVTGYHRLWHLSKTLVGKGAKVTQGQL